MLESDTSPDVNISETRYLKHGTIASLTKRWQVAQVELMLQGNWRYLKSW